MRVVVLLAILLTRCVSTANRDLLHAAEIGEAHSPPSTAFLEFESHSLRTTHEIKLRVARPADFRPAGPIDRNATFSEHAYAVSLAAYIGSKAFVMVHAERVLDGSGASNYSNLDIYRLHDQAFRTKTMCATLTAEDVAGEHDLKFLSDNGFSPVPGIYLRQLFLTTDDHNAEVVITYGERLPSCEALTMAPDFRSALDSRLRESVGVTPVL